MADPRGATSWTAPRFCDLLSRLGRLRVISACGPSVFEALCEVGAHEVAGGHLNVITDAYHWHLAVARFRHLRSHDTVHARSGRRVLFFELREAAEAAPFLRVYVHRDKGAEFESERDALFASAHAELSAGRPVEQEACG